MQFLAVALAEFGVAVFRVGVILAAQFCRGSEVFQPDDLRHQLFVNTARVEAVKEDGGLIRLRLVIVDAGDAKLRRHALFRLRWLMAW